MKNILVLATSGLLLTQCQNPKIAAATPGILNQEMQISLNQKITLRDSNKKDLGEITFTNLDESRCPAHVICVRQGAAVTTFVLQTNLAENQNVRLFIGDFMANDSRKRRNLTADTVVVQLNDKNRYQFILTAVVPYPGTSNEAAAATILLKRP
jgi:hypothetical protein